MLWKEGFPSDHLFVSSQNIFKESHGCLQPHGGSILGMCLPWKTVAILGMSLVVLAWLPCPQRRVMEPREEMRRYLDWSKRESQRANVTSLTFHPCEYLPIRRVVFLQLHNDRCKEGNMPWRAYACWRLCWSLLPGGRALGLSRQHKRAVHPSAISRGPVHLCN